MPTLPRWRWFHAPVLLLCLTLLGCLSLTIDLGPRATDPGNPKPTPSAHAVADLGIERRHQALPARIRVEAGAT